MVILYIANPNLSVDPDRLTAYLNYHWFLRFNSGIFVLSIEEYFPLDCLSAQKYKPSVEIESKGALLLFLFLQMFGDLLNYHRVFDAGDELDGAAAGLAGLNMR